MNRTVRSGRWCCRHVWWCARRAARERPTIHISSRSTWEDPMKLRILTVAVTLLVAPAAASGESEPRRLSRAAFQDKVRGGWAGQMIGVSYGAPTEFRFNGRIIEGDLPAWAPNRIENAIDQDDLYVEMTFAVVMDRVGLEATSEQYGEAFRTSKYRLWHANAGARRLVGRGIKAPWSGH